MCKIIGAEGGKKLLLSRHKIHTVQLHLDCMYVTLYRLVYVVGALPCVKYAHIGAEEGRKAIVQLPLDCIYVCPPDIGYIIDIWKPSLYMVSNMISLHYRSACQTREGYTYLNTEIP